jgi:hypothetical protein
MIFNVKPLNLYKAKIKFTISGTNKDAYKLPDKDFFIQILAG